MNLHQLALFEILFQYTVSHFISRKLRAFHVLVNRTKKRESSEL